MRLIDLFSQYIVLLLVHYINCKTSKEESMCSNSNEGSCNENMKEQFDLLYKELFIKKDNLSEDNITVTKTNSTDINFAIGDKILPYLDKFNILPFPKSRLINKPQGNMLHFIQMAYSKRLPIYFTIDQVLEPTIETIHNIQIDYLEQAFLPLMNSFLENILQYLLDTKDIKINATQHNDLLVYFGTAYFLLNSSSINSTNIILPSSIQQQCNINVKQILNQTNQTFKFMSVNKTMNTHSFNPYGIWKNTLKLTQLNRSLRFFQNTVFDITKELDSVLVIGNVIRKSSQENTYNHLKQMLKYLFDEHETNLNPLKVTHYITNHSIAYPFSSDTQANEFYNGIVTQAKAEEILPFRRNNTFSSLKAEQLFYEQYDYHSSLFHFPFSLDNWVNNKITSPKKGRLIPTVFEEVDIEHNANFMRKMINARYKGNKEKAGSLYKFRDGINMTQEFKYAKQTIQSSMKHNTSQWRSNMILHFHYLLTLANKHIVQNKKMTKEQKQSSKVKAFQTVMGADVHFQRDIHLYEQKVNMTYDEGELVDLVLEPNIIFYNELSLFIENFKSNIIDSISFISNSLNKTKDKKELSLQYEVSQLLNPIQSGISLIIEGIIMQKEPLMYDHDLQLKLNQLFYSDPKLNEYKGWYVDMYKYKPKEHLFNFNLYIKNYYTMHPIDSIDFKGVVIYKAMNYHEIGLTIVNVTNTPIRKLLTYCSYSGNEYPRGWKERVSLQGLLQLLINRQ